MIVTRFAPSPTGRLHLGHAFSAIRAHDFARERNGRFLVRIEDIDGTRSRPEHVETILRDLEWLGLGWDGEVVFQSQRLARYEAALDRLRAAGLLYPCFCTRADIAASVSAPHGPEGPVYPGTCRALVSPDLSRPHCWRIDMAKALATVSTPLTFEEGGQGRIEADPLSHGDVVLARKDAPASYHLAVTIDDAAQQVTDIVRGEDLFAATHVHRLLQALLGLPVPRYHHHALLTGADGERLAKRHGAPTLAALREAGEDGRALAETLRRGELPIGFAAAKA
ncbi:tRNA glutamyl-Q(34) synthetase GluQRS [Sphingomonas koreensis]|jgi:glutamyl-Q tRNA(Asp) synthetase|uniref:tRNA glutamyl-Q(34) synthetase GluQRS n=1 Tax=Sphingomonas koreensis TaxID=93064 RepID=A0A1L6J815_9SPHN|nr:tRNA glutamyl-Q(34) synthetase GluQRS [Sphingomonas koreensis]APR52024.1 tRNA glutamyl-Q(34) synthetase GluQRS [Sphingomonas koreensis]MDC7812397.1 tRNA glutamyl-Q(34) synthetase GluQRS [Sphingomonas koreensis]RSU22827.1 tRNA glutamyl-Q(34) synthetase GluQRS [Sphingomonas koreensis]RSU30699.1 tRNA glutamyl-Q(34) synthetase GluQRS [Sphingomonas koreensis]RSU31794.1 tRNA glutamyl-Q(34) synthetase GluQRS [Sphingomonas koreensis]